MVPQAQTGRQTDRRNGDDTILQSHRGETGLANAGVSLSKMDAPKVGKSVFCSFDVFCYYFRASHSPTVFI